jgi:hypothetical protein
MLFVSFLFINCSPLQRSITTSIITSSARTNQIGNGTYLVAFNVSGVTQHEQDGLPPIMVYNYSPLKTKNFAMFFQKWSGLNKG